MEQNYTVKQVQWGTREYQQELELRNLLLRKPLGLNLYDEDLDSEQGELHIGAFRSGILVGCLLLKPAGERELQMRQVAVSETFQKEGIGRKLVEFSEQTARDNGAWKIFLHARETAVGFYEKLGYRKVSGRYFQLGIPHFTMEKEL